MKKSIEQVEQEIESVLSENDKVMRSSAWVSAPHTDFDFEITPLTLPQPYQNRYNACVRYRGPSYREWMRGNPDGNYRRWLRSNYMRKTDLYRRGWKRMDIQIGLGDPDRYCRTRFGVIGLYHCVHIAAAEATEWFNTRPCVVALRLYLDGVSLHRIAELLH